MTKHNYYYKSYIVVVILSHTHLSVCSDLLTLRAFPRATPPSSPTKFLSRLCLDHNHENNKFYPLKHTHYIIHLSVFSPEG